jgi:hypothetical protein
MIEGSVSVSVNNTKILKDVEGNLNAYSLHIGKLHFGIRRANYW